jgi:hypothetical protein
MSLQHKMYLQNHVLTIHGTVSDCLDTVPSGAAGQFGFYPLVQFSYGCPDVDRKRSVMPVAIPKRPSRALHISISSPDLQKPQVYSSDESLSMW